MATAGLFSAEPAVTALSSGARTVMTLPPWRDWRISTARVWVSAEEMVS